MTQRISLEIQVLIFNIRYTEISSPYTYKKEREETGEALLIHRSPLIALILNCSIVHGIAMLSTVPKSHNPDDYPSLLKPLPCAWMVILKFSNLHLVL
jgi:hypothetical protein